ncbi:MAG TPA: CapA family protein [Candidatus Gracilibacteria bacterium]|nr:CapA family protein [Candidatus Gracilibacteria bacterium]
MRVAEGGTNRTNISTGGIRNRYRFFVGAAFAAGVLFVTFFLSGCQRDALQADLFKADTLIKTTGGFEAAPSGDVMFQRYIGMDEPADIVEGMFVSGTQDELLQALSQLNGRDEYEEIKILIDFDTDFDERFSWEWEALFPDTLRGYYRIEEEKDKELMALKLESELSYRSLVVAFTEFETSSPEPVAGFQQEFEKTVLSSFDPYRADELPLKKTGPAEVLYQYLLRRGTQKPQVIRNSPGAVVHYRKGIRQDTKDDAVYMVAFGDIMLGRYVRTLMDANALDYPFEIMDNDYLRVNDLLIANLEGPVTENSVRTTTGMSFGFFPDIVPVLKKFHFDVLSQANNHTLDKGQRAWEESMTLLRNGGLTAFGHPRDITNDSVAKILIRGQKFAFVGLQDVNSTIDDEKAVELVKQLKGEGYNVIPFIHWGTEYKNNPNKRQKDLAHAFIDAGAYAVIAHHPHVPQAYETYNGRPIFYSLGNAVFDQYWSAPTQEGLSVALAMAGDHMDIYFMPIKIDRSRMRLMNDEERKEFLERFSGFGEHSEEEKEALKQGKLSLTFSPEEP